MLEESALPDDYGRLSSWQIAFGMDSTPLEDRNRCQTAQASRICCWKLGISGNARQHSSTWFCVWIACKVASGHTTWNIREPILSQPGLYFELQGSMSGYMHLGVLDAIFKAWKAKQLQSHAPQIPSQAFFVIHCNSKSKPQADLTQTIISVLKASDYSQHAVSNDIELRQLQPRLQGDTVCFACSAQRHLKLGLASHESLTFSLHTHPFWEKALVTSINGVESEIQRLTSATEERRVASNAFADAQDRVQNIQQQILGVREQIAKLAEAVEHTFEWADRHQDMETQRNQLMSSKNAVDKEVSHWQGAVAQADGVPQQLLKLKNGLKELRHLATLDPADPHRSALVRKLTEEGILARAYANPVYMLEFACASLRGNLLCDGKYSLDPNANQLNDAHILY